MNAFDMPIRKLAMSCVSHGRGRRAMDIIAASAALIVLSPLMLFVAVALLIEGGRPILFVQPRIGAGGQLFRMYKFRKFDPRCDAGGLALTLANDTRMTAVGRLLASSKLDELPQLWNVLKGEMAIVGPRPESLSFAECFRDGYEAVLQYKPGLFGPAQIMFRHEALFYPRDVEPTVFYKEVLFPAKARMDLSYYGRRTIVSDAILIIRGVLIVLGMTADRPVGT
ncbi:Sugar transferase involved in LPS biosynthesis (colanic, teichoic acid) [Mesorhizobium sp. NFR06]|jgi:lipopolysaccharide/colanic/teichoic acid biosynthesis glycosyltransferase|uniref:sugar transferase n=1 Tax=Mesorhizobium sp. NFR06 TaxID=1566290 RepID=UPI0008E0ADD1|nr:sugar transferase [Mesorhizobium sp. NFR06]SFN88464.1 Sugar transferase involved in LPS biosynthesis (colanic, teichoic acid) [Mesorhizobium sp. NFR06]